MKNVYLFLFLFLFAGSLSAQTATPPSAGDGTAGNPWQISSLENLVWISQNSSHWGDYYVQTTNIDASASYGWSGGFPSIGRSTSSPFTGSYDGNGHTIDSVYINLSSYYYRGLFAVSSGTIKDLGLTNENITGDVESGGLVGQNEGTIDSCYTTGNVTGAGGDIGGLVGVSSAGNITSCYSTAAVQANGYAVGGLIGMCNYSSSAPGTISNCFFGGSVTDNNQADVGGLIGYHAYVDVKDCYDTGSVTGTNSTQVAGLVGDIINGSATRCYSVGKVVGGSSTGYGVGGLIGGVTSNATVSNCYWDITTSGCSTDGSTSGATGESDTNMKLQSTYSGWDFTNTWAINSSVNNGYPYLIQPTDHSLPVQATDFVAATAVNSVTLSWTTQSEVNNVGFNVLRQQSGSGVWQLVASYVSDGSLKGLGTSSTGRSYNFTDDQVVSGMTYQYEVQSVSTDGTTKDLTTLSVTVNVPKTCALYQNYPDPFNPSTTIRFDLNRQSTVTLDVYNVLGERVLHQDFGTMNAGEYNRSLDLAQFASGTYFYRIAAQAANGERFVSVKKLMLIK